jgi:2-oxoglutarate dehydrogenase E2 component (dihydrolipoamide succinyltransferase)
VSGSPPERARPRRRAPIGLADAPLADYRPEGEGEAPAPASAPASEPAPAPVARQAPARPGRGRAPRPRPAPAPARAPDPRAEPTPLSEEATRSVNFHIPRSLDRVLGRLKYELESEYGVRTSKTALAAAALYALPREPLAALRWLRAYEAAALPVEGPGGPPEA